MPAPDVVAGRFALCDPLARGATGTVWRAWDLRRGDWCAAKVMRQRDAGDLLRFAREQAVRLEHPHVLTPYSWAAEDAHVVVASPLIGGGSLHTLVGDHGPLAPDLVADLLDQLLDGLAHVHAAGVVHRDVTPANVLLEATGDGRPVARLADFGLAVRAGEPRLTRLGTVLGTPGYVPPEVLAGAAPHPAADLYAAGRVALTLLSGGDPGGSWAGGRHRRLRDVVAALTADDPGRRPGSAAEARAALGAVPVRYPATADGDPVTVLSQLPELPDGWTPGGGPVADGPEVGTGPVRPAGSTARLPAAPVTPAASAGPGLGAGAAAAPGPGAGPTARAGAADSAYAGSGPARVRATDVPDPAAGPAARAMAESGPATPGGAAGRSGGGKWRWGWGVGVVGVLATVGVVLAVVLGGRGGPEPGSVPTTPPGASVVSGPAVAGGVCGWQQEGDGATEAGGRALRCTRTADGFRWQPR